ncbi:MAG: hypothetical protein HN608_01015, partial [Rhodospirillaceae bacterium]|nr:hypothetical protein [Rhodospirillaceae bacterium]
MIGTTISRLRTTPLTRPVAITAAAMAATIGLLLLPVTGQARGAPDSFADLAASLYPAVVNISTTQV